MDDIVVSKKQIMKKTDTPQINIDKAIEFYKKAKASQRKAMAKYRKTHPDVIRAINKRYYEKRKKSKKAS